MSAKRRAARRAADPAREPNGRNFPETDYLLLFSPHEFRAYFERKRKQYGSKAAPAPSPEHDE